MFSIMLALFGFDNFCHQLGIDGSILSACLRVLRLARFSVWEFSMARHLLPLASYANFSHAEGNERANLLILDGMHCRLVEVNVQSLRKARLRFLSLILPTIHT